MTEQEKAPMDFYYWRVSRCDSFATQLFDLICKADSSNQLRIETAFPYHIDVWREWHGSPNEKEFLEALRDEFKSKSIKEII